MNPLFLQVEMMSTVILVSVEWMVFIFMIV